MIKVRYFVTVAISFLWLFSCAQTKTNLAESFLESLNNYNVDSLKLITSVDFQLIEKYANYSQNKAEFLDTFVTFSKSLNGKFYIEKTLSKGNPTVYLVRDVSVYSKYLDLPPLNWKLTISCKNGKVAKMTSDSTPGFKYYMDKFMIKHDNFIMWLDLNYPGETENHLLKNSDGLFEKRLKEYSLTVE